jgi:hypothetical protein
MARLGDGKTFQDLVPQPDRWVVDEADSDGDRRMEFVCGKWYTTK